MDSTAGIKFLESLCLEQQGQTDRQIDKYGPLCGRLGPPHVGSLSSIIVNAVPLALLTVHPELPPIQKVF